MSGETKPPGANTCLFCGKQFTNPKDLFRHSATHLRSTDDY